MEVKAAAPRCQLLLIVLMAAMLLPGMKSLPLLVRRNIARTIELQESISKGFSKDVFISRKQECKRDPGCTGFEDMKESWKAAVAWHCESLGQAIGKNAAQLQQKTPAFRRCQYRKMTTTTSTSSSSSCGVESDELCVLYRADSKK
ncbi:hypothetical protein STEG23_013307 [Scotinomys teguina]